MKKFSRRDVIEKAILSGALLGNDPVQILLRYLFSKPLLDQALAATPIAPRRHFVFHQKGGPVRWGYDLFLNPMNDPRFQDFATHGMGTCFKDSSTDRYEEMAFEQVKVGDLWLPYLWSIPVPAPSGGTRPHTDLLQHMLQIKGINTGNSSHEGALKNLQLPPGASQSLNSLSGDHAKSPFPVIAFGFPQWDFLSKTGKVPVLIDKTSGNLINRVLDSFRYDASLDSLKGLVGDDMKKVREALYQQKMTSDLRYEKLIAHAQTARDLMERDFGDLNAQWQTLLDKYQTLVRRSLDSVIPKINDKKIGIDPTQRNESMGEYRISASRISYEDDPALITNRLASNPSDRLRFPEVAEYFALSEFLIQHDLTYDFSGYHGDIGNFYVREALGGALNPRAFDGDPHNIGMIHTNWIFPLSFVALSACALEFIDQVKAMGKFNDTIFEIRSEFNRNPRTDLSGSDHGWQGASTCIYSGIINGPQLFGNTYFRNPAYGSFRSWGEGAPMDCIGGIPLDVGHYGATLATLLRVPSPVIRPSVVKEEEPGVIELIEEEAKIVDG